jgi:hypothetical protein
MILSSLPRLLSYLCPGINDREITHLVASLSVNVPLENDLLPEGMPTLRNHVLNLLSTRAVYWAMRCKITDEPLPADMSDDMPPTSGRWCGHESPVNQTKHSTPRIVSRT